MKNKGQKDVFNAAPLWLIYAAAAAQEVNSMDRVVRENSLVRI